MQQRYVHCGHFCLFIVIVVLKTIHFLLINHVSENVTLETACNSLALESNVLKSVSLGIKTEFLSKKCISLSHKFGVIVNWEQDAIYLLHFHSVMWGRENLCGLLDCKIY